MKKTVWKYPLMVTDEQYIEAPANAHLLTVQWQHTMPCIWALVDPTNPLERRKILITGTGHEREDLAGFVNYIGTFQINGGLLVFHVFEDTSSVELASAETFVEHEEKPPVTQEVLLAHGI